jgi:hypothetical protein
VTEPLTCRSFPFRASSGTWVAHRDIDAALDLLERCFSSLDPEKAGGSNANGAALSGDSKVVDVNVVAAGGKTATSPADRHARFPDQSLAVQC